MTIPSDIAQQALDAAGIEYTLGDISDGTRPAQVLLRAYSPGLKQLLRAARWDFARKESPLVLLADVTGNTPNVGTMVPNPWTYSYALPIDAVQVRFVPANWAGQNPGVPTGNIVPPDPTAPLMTNLTAPPLNGQRIIPAKFVIGTDYNNLPPQPGYETPGISPSGRTAIFTNVQYAQVVYTCNSVYPSIWDDLFRAAFVSWLAAEIALPLSKDKKFGLTLRAENIKIAKDKILQARIADGNSGNYSSDISVDWMRARGSGGSGGYGLYGGYGGVGIGDGWGCGYGSISFADGSSF